MKQCPVIIVYEKGSRASSFPSNSPSALNGTLVTNAPACFSSVIHNLTLDNKETRSIAAPASRSTYSTSYPPGLSDHLYCSSYLWSYRRGTDERSFPLRETATLQQSLSLFHQSKHQLPPRPVTNPLPTAPYLVQSPSYIWRSIKAMRQRTTLKKWFLIHAHRQYNAIL